MLCPPKISAAYDFNAALSCLDLKSGSSPQQPLSPTQMSSTGLMAVARQREAGMGSRLQDSMEFYKRQGVQVGSSPPSSSSPLEYSQCREIYCRADCQSRGNSSQDDDEEEEEEDDGICFEESEGEEDDDGILFVADEGEEGNLWSDTEEDEEAEESDSDQDDEVVFEDYDGEAVAEPHEKIETPFWFGNEDRCQIKSIIGSYCSFLKVDEDRKKRIREPEPFVGRVKRVVVYDDEGEFTTMDKVEIFKRSKVPPGTVMPLVKSSCVLTNWSTEDGVPTQFYLLDKKEMQDLWEDRAVPGASVSFLLCMPDFDSPWKEYDYSVSHEVQEVTHSPRSTKCEETMYAKYIPEDLVRQVKEKNVLFMEMNSRPEGENDLLV